jgi:hypothetical protein
MLLIICLLLLLLIPGVFRNLMGLIGWLILIGIAVSLFH